MKNLNHKRRSRMSNVGRLLVHLVGLLPVILGGLALGQEPSVVQLKDFTQMEVKSGGFILPSETRIHIHALGGGSEDMMNDDDGDLYAYGWIINAETRTQVWKMDLDNTSSKKDDRVFNGDIVLPGGSYEVYFAAYAFVSRSSFGRLKVNIDRRKDISGNDTWKLTLKRWGFLSWLDGFFGEDIAKEWKQRVKEWGIDVSIADGSTSYTTFSPPKEFPNVLFQAVRLGEREYIKQGFTLKKEMPIHIYALGEATSEEEMADYGWIINATTHKRVWEMQRTHLRPAGGASKNVKFDNTITFPAGEFILYYTTDDSHSFVDWNAAPPDDPFNYGISLIATTESDKPAFKLSTPKEDQNVIAQIVRVGNDETKNTAFTLKKETRVHIYAIGERSLSNRQMVDYGWIINARTREKVWTMDVDKTEHAGGAQKNRMVDEVMTLPKGTYIVYFQTDDSHAYNDWNSPPPLDAEHYGITLTGEGENFTMNNVEKNTEEQESGIIAQIIQVGDDAKEVRTFTLDKPTHVRVYAIGEGQNREMYDYGWIESAAARNIVWEMTYEMTFHAGGGRKNRMVNTTILLDKGEYKLHYVSDDSHSYNNWNTDPPDDPTMWGITLYREEP
jgi:hypothetical protein